MNIEYYDDIIVGGGKAGKTLAPALAAKGRKNDRLETNISGIWALGDINGGPQYTHTSQKAVETTNEPITLQSFPPTQNCCQI